MHLGKIAEDAGIGFVSGVPDSVLRPIIAELGEHFRPGCFKIAANEGSAIGLAVGYHLATRGVPLVFLQNSGLGNALNPLMSLAHKTVFSIPMVMLIGWRGAITADGDQAGDEPQHLSQGRATLGILDLLEVPYEILDSSSPFGSTIVRAVDQARASNSPVAIVVRPDVRVETHERESDSECSFPIREEVIRTVFRLANTEGSTAGPVISTTGMASRELYSLAQSGGKVNQAVGIFPNVGAMGHAIAIATTVAAFSNRGRTYCIDGDGAMLMHMGSLLHASQESNLTHILVDNGVHDSVGGQPTGFSQIDVASLAKAFAYESFFDVSTIESLEMAIRECAKMNCGAFIRVRVRRGHRSDLGRPTESPVDLKKHFSSFLINSHGPGI